MHPKVAQPTDLVDRHQIAGPRAGKPTPRVGAGRHGAHRVRYAPAGVVTFVGALFLLAFIGWQLSIRGPLVNLAVFSHLRYAAAAVVALIFGAGIYGSSYLVPLFVQAVQGYTPTRAGELLIPGGPILGGAFGVSLLSAAIEVRFAFHADALAANQTVGNATTLELLDRIGSLEGNWGVPAIQTLAGALDYLARVIPAQAQSLAYGDGFAIVGIVFWAGIVPALWMRARH
jgi:hypothetical protein